MSRTLAIFVMLVLVPFMVWAQPQPIQDPLIDRLIGNWVLRGTIDGKETTHDVAFEWVLGHQYVRLHEVSREKDERGQPAYEAIVFIGRDPASGGYACLWLDSTGGGGITAQAIGHATRGSDELAFVFRVQDDNSFHTTFAYSKSGDTWQWKMDAEQGGKRQPFARVALTRK